MSNENKSRSDILAKLGIESLNPMQEDAFQAIISKPDVVILSPTGTGKTLAFLLPLIARLDQDAVGVQALILAPSRELALQIEQVAREMGSGYKVNAVYGGRSGAKDKIELKHPPAILIGTPGRVADHIRRGTFATDSIQNLVLDEFDKSLEVGFEKDMTEILDELRNLKRRILTSATEKQQIPEFVGMHDPARLVYLQDEEELLQIKTVESPTKDKLDTLVDLLGYIGKGRGIVFCNFRSTIDFVSDHLNKHNISHANFYGGMEQRDRERSLIRFRNGSRPILLATDLAARGIDVDELDFIIHYQIPKKEAEFIHRNGRTARMHSEGTAYILKYEGDTLWDFAKEAEEIKISRGEHPTPATKETLFISGGRRDKISKGDIAGLFLKVGGLTKDELGLIELKHDCAFVAVPETKAKSLASKLNNHRLKKKKVRIQILD